MISEKNIVEVGELSGSIVMVDPVERKDGTPNYVLLLAEKDKPRKGKIVAWAENVIKNKAYDSFFYSVTSDFMGGGFYCCGDDILIEKISSNRISNGDIVLAHLKGGASVIRLYRNGVLYDKRGNALMPKPHKAAKIKLNKVNDGLKFLKKAESKRFSIAGRVIALE